MQLRQMQLGGNAKATSFFRQQNANTSDTQQKYNSRAAQLYREKLHQSAAQAMRLHGTKLHIDTGTEVESEAPAKEEEDFFSAEHEQRSLSDHSSASNPLPTPSSSNGDLVDENAPAPNVDLALSAAPQKPAPRKSTIGGRKPIAKKPGLGGKKAGMGAQKVTKSFAEVEREAEMADQVASVRKEEKVVNEAKSAEENAKAMANMRLAYQDLGVQQKKNEEKMAKVDPSKAAQVERLGMGFGGFGGGGQSHSLTSGMSVINQEEPNNVKKTNFQSSTKEKFFDDFEVVDVEKTETPWRTSRVDEICEPSRGDKSSSSSAWEKDLNENMKSNKKQDSNNWDNDFESKTTSSNTNDYSSSRRQAAPVTSAPSSEDAVKRYGNAKSISSDQYFGGNDDNERDANASRFQGSNSISSAEYFGRNEGMSRSSSSYSANLSAPDMDDVKESVRQGVSKVAGRLSGLASGIMNQVQDKYGY